MRLDVKMRCGYGGGQAPCGTPLLVAVGSSDATIAGRSLRLQAELESARGTPVHLCRDLVLRGEFRAHPSLAAGIEGLGSW